MWNIDKHINKAHTLHTDFYTDLDKFNLQKENIFAQSWQYIGDRSDCDEKGQLSPLDYLPGILDEPLLLSNDGKQVRCLSNVCTHRGNILIEQPTKQRLISCAYHGRCFGLNGKFRSMPAFEEVENFPCADDNLAEIPLEEWYELRFISLDPQYAFEKLIQPISAYVSTLPLDRLQFHKASSKAYTVQAHWALYIDNFLEGFHIPFVHPGLHEAISFDQYEYHLFEKSNLQVAFADEGQPHFEFELGHPHHGKPVFAYYYWVYPNMMFNFYPWGLSFNYIRPISIDKTEVLFRTYLFESAYADAFLDSAIDQTEMEDESIVERVQKGVRSRYYTKGRFEPVMEQCVHHFHRLLAQSMVSV